jgi:hypothetical protein
MRYLASRPDGGVAIISCPLLSAISSNGEKFKIEAFKRAPDHAVVVLRNERRTVALVTSRDFEADGWTFVHMDPRAFVARLPKRSDVMARVDATVEPAERDRNLAIVAKMIFADDALTITPINEEEIPRDRTFRDGWYQEEGKIEHNMEKCRAIHRCRMRDARSLKLAALDIEYQRADEVRNERRKREVATLKQELRDVTSLLEIEAAQTPEDLKKIWPDCLK